MTVFHLLVDGNAKGRKYLLWSISFTREDFTSLLGELEKQLCMPDSKNCKPMQKMPIITISIKIAG